MVNSKTDYCFNQFEYITSKGLDIIKAASDYLTYFTTQHDPSGDTPASIMGFTENDVKRICDDAREIGMAIDSYIENKCNKMNISPNEMKDILNESDNIYNRASELSSKYGLDDIGNKIEIVENKSKYWEQFF